MDTLNACTTEINSAAGDTVFMGGVGGSYTKQFTVPVGGADASHYVLYAGIESDTPTIDVSGVASASGIFIEDKSFVKVYGFDVIGSGTAGAVRLQGTSGQEGKTVEVRNVDVVSNNASTTNCDCFSMDETAQAIFNYCNATKCRESSPSSGSHQCLATHTASIAEWNYGTMDSSNYWAVAVGGSRIDINNLLAKNFTIEGFDVNENNSKLYVYNSILQSGNKGTKIASSGLGATAAEICHIEACTLSCDSGALALVRARLELIDNVFNINSRGSSFGWRPYQAGAVILARGNTFTITDCAAYLFNGATSDAGKMYLYNNRVKIASADGFANANASLPAMVVSGNLFDSCQSTQVINFIAASTGTHEVSRNTFYRDASGGIGVKLGSISAGSINVSGNIFKNIADAINGTPTVVSYNDYYLSSNEGGTGSKTDDPAFVDSTDFKITNTSPCYNTGIKTALLYDAYGNPIPNATGGYSMGWYEVNDSGSHACVWQGDVDSAFSNAANWENGIIPGDSDAVIYTDAADRNCVWNQNVTVLEVLSDSTLDKNVYLGSGTHDVRLAFDLRCPTCSLFNQTSALSVGGDITYPSTRVVPGTSTLTADGAGAQTLTNIKAYDFVKSGAGAATFASRPNISGDYTVSAGATNLAYGIESAGDVLIGGTGIPTIADSAKMNGNTGTFGVASTVGTPVMTAMTLWHNRGTIDIDVAATIMALVIVDTVTNSGAVGTVVYNSAGIPLTLLDSAYLINSARTTFRRTTAGDLVAIAPTANIGGASILDFRHNASGLIINVPAINSTNSGGLLFYDAAAGIISLYAQTGNLVSTGPISIYRSGATNANSWRQNGYSIAAANFNFGCNNATGTFNFHRRGIINVSGAINGTAYNLGTTNDYDTSVTSVGTNMTYQTSFNHFPAPGQSLTMTGDGTTTFAGKYKPKKMVVSGGARVFADHWYTDSLDITGGSLAVTDHAGVDTVAGDAAFTGTSTGDFSGDTCAFGGNVSGAGNHIVYNAASLWKMYGTNKKITGFDTDTLPKTQFLGGGGF
jgi:hypothetical protein